MSALKTQFTLRLSLDIYAKIKKIAEDESRSATNMIEYILKREVEKYEKENGEIIILDEDLYLK